jgi:putative Mn2+ efflux pump MntP
MFSSPLVRVFLIALSLGLDVFAVCVGVGMRDPGTAAKIRIGAAFAAAETTMTVLGAGVGHAADSLFGDMAAYFGFIALTLVGIFMIVENLRESESRMDLSCGWGLFTAALSISLDSLGIGFSIIYIGVPLVLSLTVIASVSILCCALGLLFGRMLGRHMEEVAGVAAGVILTLTGVIFTALRYYHVG